MGNIWELVNARHTFKTYQKSWQKLWEKVGKRHPLLDYDFVEPLVTFFGSEDLYLALYGEEGEKGMALLGRKSFGVWESFTPGPSPLAMIMIDIEATENNDLAVLVRSLPGLASLLGIQRIDPVYRTIAECSNDPRAIVLDYTETVRIRIQGTFENYWQNRSKNLKRNIIKKKNRIIKEGIKSTFKELKSVSDIHSSVNIYGQLETKGWKGKKGSAVNADNRLGRFYKQMLENFARKNATRIYQLCFDGHVVASCLSIIGGGMNILLKITYDEQFADYSPGWMLMYEIHKKLFDEEQNYIEYYTTSASKGLRQWSDDNRIIYHMNYFRWPFLKFLYTKIKK